MEMTGDESIRFFVRFLWKIFGVWTINDWVAIQESIFWNGLLIFRILLVKFSGFLEFKLNNLLANDKTFKINEHLLNHLNVHWKSLGIESHKCTSHHKISKLFRMKISIVDQFPKNNKILWQSVSCEPYHTIFNLGKLNFHFIFCQFNFPIVKILWEKNRYLIIYFEWQTNQPLKSNLFLSK